MSKEVISSGLGLALWMAATWFFYLGYSSDLVAISMIFIPIITVASFGQNHRPLQQNFTSSALTLCYLGLGIGIHEALSSLGGFSYVAGVLFGNEIVMVTTNAIFALHVFSKFTRGNKPLEQPVV